MRIRAFSVALVLGVGSVLSSAAVGGPVILVGHDQDDHGFEAIYAGVFDDLFAAVTNGNTGILSIGADSGTKAETWINTVAGLMTSPQTVTHVNGAAVGTVDFCTYAIVYIPSDLGDVAGGISQAETTIMAGRAVDVANFINGGGGLFGSTAGQFADAYGYMGVFAAITSTGIPVSGSCGGSVFDDITATTEGGTLGITNSNLDGCCWHNTFTTFAPFLNALATANEPSCAINGEAAAIGCLDCSLPPQKLLEPAVAFNLVNTNHTVTATLLEAIAPNDPIVGVLTTFEVISGPNTGDMGTDTTDINGQASFTYTGDGGIGLDLIKASCPGGAATCNDPLGSTIDSNTVQKFWDLDCNNNGIPDTCDISCAAYGNACLSFPMCGGSVDVNLDSIPDDCSVCGDSVVDPGEQCDDGNTSNGDCCSSTCQYESAGSVCGNQTPEGTCDAADSCDTTGTCLPNYLSAATVCRAGSGDSCDPDEVCTGSSGTCPVDSFEPGTTVCRTGSGDSCDPDENCPGVAGGACPADTITTVGTVCNPGSGDLCDPDEVCSGVAGQACPTDTISPNGTVCNAGSGDLCDPDEVCSGVAGQACPADTITPVGTVCNPGSGDLCDPDEVCSGVADQACPADAVAAVGTVCNPGSGDLCDPDEVCSGVAGQACPADTITPVGTVCNAGSGDLCDPDEVCSGVAGQACPADTISPNGTVCNPGSGDLCDPDEVCSGVAGQACPPDTITPVGTVCNPGSGDLCDPDEVCSGVAGQACPADSFDNGTTVCRPSVGACDVDELCPGVSDQACPGDSVKPNSYKCRPEAGNCDVPEYCDGILATCPADEFKPPIDGKGEPNICRPANGICDPAEICPGDGPDCPPDEFEPSTTICRGSLGVCDPPELCTGINGDCPPDVLDNTTVCNPSAGVCDPAEICDGVNPGCPADVLDNTTVCNPSAGVCDPAEICDGVNPSCPADVLDNTTVCNPSTGVCDPAEICDGVNPGCPADVLDNTTVCNPSAGVCDPAEICDGVNPGCPADVLDNTTVCNPSAGVCDPPEVCDGVNPGCPADVLDNTTVCRPAAGECDVDEICDGMIVDCPADGFEPNGLGCTDEGDECTNDVCDGLGMCVHPNNNLCGGCCLPDKVCIDDVLASTCGGLFGNHLGIGSVCLGDTDGDGVDDQCDNCSGVDDNVFGVLICTQTGKSCVVDADCEIGDTCEKACVGKIPTVSEWGLVVLALLLLVAGKLYFGFRPVPATIER